MALWKPYGNLLRGLTGRGTAGQRLRGCSKPCSAFIGIAARTEQLRRVAESYEAFVGDPERVA
jgi:hypothetical protein